MHSWLGFRQAACFTGISSATPGQSAVDAFHVIGERMGVHRNLGVTVCTEKLRAFHTDSPVAQSGALGGTRNHTDVC